MFILFNHAFIIITDAGPKNIFVNISWTNKFQKLYTAKYLYYIYLHAYTMACIVYIIHINILYYVITQFNIENARTD